MYELVAGALKLEETLVLADLHVGYAAQLRADGMHVPTNEADTLLRKLKGLLEKTNPRRVVINGDLKHAFGCISDDEWRTIKELRAVIEEHAQLILIKGNHDPLLQTIADELELPVHEQYVTGETLIIHGDTKPENLNGIKRIVIGHQHPAIRIGNNIRTELVKCYLVGEYCGRELIVLPSYFDLQEGSDVLQEKSISPLIKSFSDYEVHALIGDETLHYGTVADVAAMREETL